MKDIALKLIHLIILSVFCLVNVACKQTPESLASDKVKESNLAEASKYNMQLGLGYLKQGNMPRAKRKLLTALTQMPDSAEVHSALGYFMEKTGEIKEANAYYLKAISLAPGAGAQLNNYGTFLCRQGDYAKAETYFMRAVNDKRYENIASAYENAALCSMAHKQDEQAATYFKKALEQDGTKRTSLQELVKLQVKKGDLTQAMWLLHKYPAIALQDIGLLKLAVSTANRLGDSQQEQAYQSQLDRLQHVNEYSENTGVNHEYNRYNG